MLYILQTVAECFLGYILALVVPTYPADFTSSQAGCYTSGTNKFHVPLDLAPASFHVAYGRPTLRIKKKKIRYYIHENSFDEVCPCILG